jgi:hypothetical protein
MTLSTFIRRTFAAALTAAALALPVHSVAAQGDRDMQTLANYHLNESSLRKYYKAMGNLTKAVLKDTSLAVALDASSSGDEDIAAIAAKYDRVPALKSALAAAGLTSLDFATFTLSYMQAAMAYGFMSQGPENMRIKEVPKGTPKENVDFVRTHQALIQQLDKELKALMPADSSGNEPTE